MRFHLKRMKGDYIMRYLVLLADDYVIGIYDNYDEALAVAKRIAQNQGVYTVIYHAVKKEVIE